MDGTMDVESQIRLMRAVIGRKSMEIDDYIDKSSESPDDGSLYESLIEFLKNDIKGYKAVIEDLKKGTEEVTGNYYEISSLPEKVVGLYNDYYLPSLSAEDYNDETVAMSLKNDHVNNVVQNKYVRIGKAALDNPLLLALMSQNRDITALLGKIVLSEPELINALNEESN